MRLVVDTSVLVGELLRTKGRERLADERLDLFLPERMWGEVQVELPRRIAEFARRRGLTHATRDGLTALSLEAVRTNMVVIEVAVYSALEEEARARSRRDPDDWPVVACALALTAGVWTNDNDFLGTGIPTWTTDTLQDWLARHPPPAEEARG
jgi:predicted nucleic acid-binding protein